jgi:hypothetical protein
MQQQPLLQQIRQTRQRSSSSTMCQVLQHLMAQCYQKPLAAHTLCHMASQLCYKQLLTTAVQQPSAAALQLLAAAAAAAAMPPSVCLTVVALLQELLQLQASVALEVLAPAAAAAAVAGLHTNVLMRWHVSLVKPWVLSAKLQEPAAAAVPAQVQQQASPLSKYETVRCQH